MQKAVLIHPSIYVCYHTGPIVTIITLLDVYTSQLGNSLHRVQQNEPLHSKMQFNREEINNHTSTWKKSQIIEIMHIQSE